MTWTCSTAGQGRCRCDECAQEDHNCTVTCLRQYCRGPAPDGLASSNACACANSLLHASNNPSQPPILGWIVKSGCYWLNEQLSVLSATVPMAHKQ